MSAILGLIALAMLVVAIVTTTKGAFEIHTIVGGLVTLVWALVIMYAADRVDK